MSWLCKTRQFDSLFRTWPFRPDFQSDQTTVGRYQPGFTPPVQLCYLATNPRVLCGHLWARAKRNSQYLSHVTPDSRRRWDKGSLCPCSRSTLSEGLMCHLFRALCGFWFVCFLMTPGSTVTPKCGAQGLPGAGRLSWASRRQWHGFGRCPPGRRQRSFHGSAALSTGNSGRESADRWRRPLQKGRHDICRVRWNDRKGGKAAVFVGPGADNRWDSPRDGTECAWSRKLALTPPGWGRWQGLLGWSSQASTFQTWCGLFSSPWF